MSEKQCLTISLAGFLNASFKSPVYYGYLMSCFLLAGLNPNMNVNNMDITGGLSVKDTSQSQSRLPQWTHPNSMDNLSSAASSLDQNSSKHGMSLGQSAFGRLESYCNCDFFLVLIFLVSAWEWLVQSTLGDYNIFEVISAVTFSNALKFLQLSLPACNVGMFFSFADFCCSEHRVQISH